MSVPLPPKQAPKAKAQTRGWKGKFKLELEARRVTTGIIIAVKGMLSTKAEHRPDVHKSSASDTVSW